MFTAKASKLVKPAGPNQGQLPTPPHSSSASDYDPDSISGLIDAFFSGLNDDGTPYSAEDLNVEDCLTEMVRYVEEHQLHAMFGATEEEQRENLRPQAEVASLLPRKLKYVKTELAIPLTVMSLYDLVVLIDDSRSMEFVESGKRKTALKDVLYFLARLYGAVSGEARGIKAIRFLNGEDDVGADDLMSKDEIDKLIKGHKFDGLTCIGAGLMRKILKPFVFAEGEVAKKGVAKKLAPMDRPLLVMVIIDGVVEGENPKWLEKAIKSAVDSFDAAEIGVMEDGKNKGIVFQFARVGNDTEAEEFLKKLDEDSPVSKYVDTLSGNDLMTVMGTRAAEGEPYTVNDLQMMIKLLLGPISEIHDNLEKKMEHELGDVLDDLLCDDDDEPEFII